jgi:hypothetical protein
MAAEEQKAGARVTLKEIENTINVSSLTPVVNKGKSLSGKNNQKIEGYNFINSDGKGLKMLSVSNCEDVVIRRCRFHGVNLTDVMLSIDGSKTKNVIIEYCIFENSTSRVSNGGEPIRLGTSSRSGCRFECIVRKCIFRDLRADPETISIKSAGNEIHDCYFINNKSMVTVRHGGLATIHHNTFEGNNGVRLLGYGNKVSYNLFKNNSATDKMSPIQVQWANAEKDPNWDEVDKPSGEDGESHAKYAQCVDNQINFNEFENCKNKIFYRKDKIDGKTPKYGPKNLKIVDKPDVPPTPPPPEPEEVEPTPTKPECSICNNEPATKKLILSIHVGPNCYARTKELLLEALKTARAEATTGTGGGQ